MSDVAAPAEDARKNLKSEHRGLIATVRNDITIPMYTGVLSPLDDTLVQRGQGKGLKIYEEIERDTHAYSVLNKRRNELVAREWELSPASESAEDKAVAAFVATALKALPFDRLCRDLLDATLKGFATVEIVWGRTGNAILPVKFVDHDQRRFAFDEDWQLRLLTREAMREGIPVPDRNIIVHRFGVKGNNPYGLGLGSRLFWPVLFKREGIAFWMTFLDKYASPTPVGKTPIGMEPAEQLKVLQMLEGIAQGYGITVPIGTELSLLEATRSAPASYEGWARYWDEQMSICVLGETLSTVIGSVGSQAAATVHTESKSQLIDGDGDLLADTLQDTLLRWIVDFNFPGRAVPKVYRLRPKNEEAIAKARGEIAKAEKAEIDAFNSARGLVEGMDETAAIGVMRVVSALAARMEVPALAAILKTPRPRAPAPPSAQKPNPSEKAEDPEPAAFAAPGDVLDKAHFPEAVYDAFEAGLLAPIDDWMARARASLFAATSIDDAAERALHLVVDLPIEQLAAQIADAHLFSDLLGRASVAIEAEEVGVVTAPLFADAEVAPGIVFKGAPMPEAIEFLRQKVAMPQAHWSTLKREGHDRAFVVAGNLREDVARDLQSMVSRNLENGQGLKGFEKDFGALLSSDKWTGDPELLTNGKKRAWRARTIFMTNLSTAHAAGRMKQQRALKHVLPFWQYRHAATRTPQRARPPHLRLNGMTLSADDPVWSKIYPQNGWLCSCGVRAITAAAAERVDPSLRKAPGPREIDSAVPSEWQYMPGDTWERGLVPPELQKPLTDQFDLFPSRTLPPLSASSRPLTADRLAKGLSPEAYADAFLKPFGTHVGGPGVLFRDRAGQQIAISDALMRDGKGQLKMKRDRGPEMARLAETLMDPDEIWIEAEKLRSTGEWVLVRRYLRSDPATQALSSFVWSGSGWTGRTTFPLTKDRDTKPNAEGLERQRRGALLYRREEEKEPAR